MKGWAILIRERFPLGAYGPMIAVFVAAHVTIARHHNPELSLTAIAAVVFLTTSLFLRLRFFDEIKDYQLDCKINPHRPLPRGVLTLPQVKRGIYALTILEVVVASATFGVVGLWWLMPLLFSFTMFKEFFIGPLIRPHLTTYAVMHTLVSSMLVLAQLQLLTRQTRLEISGEFAIMALIAWPLFNLFEFGRKTYLKNEERPTVDTYSSLFGAWGASALGISQIVAAVVLARFLIGTSIREGQWLAIYFASALSVLSALLYAAIQQAPFQTIYRALSSAHILLFYLAICIKL